MADVESSGAPAVVAVPVAPSKNSQVIKVYMPTYIMAPTEDER
jgi:hypothetical protein